MLSLLVGAVLAAVLFVYPLWRIFARTGLPPALSLVVILPFGAFIVPAILAFARWPKLQRRPA